MKLKTGDIFERN